MESKGIESNKEFKGDAISFRIGSRYYCGFIEPYDIHEVSKRYIDSYINAALAYHLHTLLSWEEKGLNLHFSTGSKRIETWAPHWYGDEIKESETILKNLMYLEEALPMIFERLSDLSPENLGLLEERLEEIDSLEEKIGILYTMYVNRRSQSSAIIAIFISILAIFISFISLYYSKTKSSLRMSPLRTLKYKVFLKIKYWFRKVG